MSVGYPGGMTAFACLRILPPSDLHSRPGLEGLINRYACAFLEARWSWPRRFEVMSLSAFLLADPRTPTLEQKILQDLAYDLQLRLFGSGGAGEVELIVFEGESGEVARFASLDQHEVRRAVRSETLAPPLVGRLTRITVDDVRPIAVPGSPNPDLPPAPVRTAVDPAPATPCFQGVYFAGREAFVGCAVSNRESGFNLVDGLHPAQRDIAREHDAGIIAMAVDLLARQARFSGMFYLPVCYTSLIHRQEREDYRHWLNALPESRRSNLAVSVYDTPRDPSFSALSQVKAFLDSYFKVVDLQTGDPDFAVERLAIKAVHSVTLVLPEASQLARIAAIRRFAERIDLFRQKRIWPSISNVRNAVELETCLARRIPFVAGRAVSGPLSHPVGLLSLGPDQLPLDDRALHQAAAAPPARIATA
jgi:hypothetical protein